ncbi:hypothetical protein [Granulicella tundricola]|uniref:hypothetical protein n=1 Tax=Granulicella tundricola TaxID=940615 RepID=UPI0018DB5CCA|nr:hypothetical protein [Granulicella tundricola]
MGRVAIAFKKPEAVSRMDILGGLFGILLIPGLLGFAYQRPEGPHLFWIVAIPVQVVFSLCELFAPKMEEWRQKKGTLIYVLTLVFQVALGVPALYALVRYAYFSPQLWR